MKYIKNHSIKSKTAHSLITIGLLSAVSLPLQAQTPDTSRDWAHPVGYTNNDSSLRGYLVRLREALILQQSPGQTGKPLELKARVTAESRSGVRRLRIRDFQFLSDSPRTIAGYNLGAGSWPTEVGVLGSAVAQEFLIQAALKGIPLDQVEVVFTSRPEAGPPSANGRRVTYPNNLEYTAYIVSSAFDAELEELRRTVERTSPVLNLVSQAQEIEPGKLFYTQTPAKREENVLAGLREFLVEKRAALTGTPPAEAPTGTASTGTAGRRRGRRNRSAGEGTNSGSPVHATSTTGAPAGQAALAGQAVSAGQTNQRSNGEPPLRAHIKVEGGSGIRRIRTDSSNFQIIHDNPRFLAGYNLGPIAEEHQLGVMITCLTHIFEIQAAQRQVVIDSLELEVEGTLTAPPGSGGDNPPRLTNIRYNVHIGSPEPREVIEKLHQAVEEVCPIYNMLKNAQEIKGKIVHGPYPYKEPGQEPSSAD